MKIRIWGSRGSTPVNGVQFAHYSGETSCIEVITNAGEIILLDAGTGLRSYALARKKQLEAGENPAICLSHLHFDHVQGLPFYPPLYGQEVKIYGPQFPEGAPFSQNLAKLFDGVLFPVSWQDLKKTEAIGIAPNSGFKIGSASIEAMRTNHPGGNLAWKIRADGETLVYTGDHEIPLDGNDPDMNATHNNLLRFMADADLVICDSHYSRSDHEAHQGWGHSDFEQWLEVARQINIGMLCFSHFSPDYVDGEIDALLEAARKAAPSLKLACCRPGMEIDLDKADFIEGNSANFIYDFLLKISHLSDTYAILDALLTEARRLAHADAGTVYLVEDKELVFAAAHNDTLFPGSDVNKYAYMNARMPLSKASVAGYVAATGKSLNIADVYNLDQGLEYGFNDAFDKKTGYRTKSMLAVPLINGKGKVVGVLQLINAQEDGKLTEFDARAAFLISRLANMATLPLEKALLVVNMIMRMLQTSALRDPTETSAHVQRVGSIAAELYHNWANSRHLKPEEILPNKSRLRLAAMLHDIGKVGIPDGVLKKPDRLTDDERRIMQSHSALGAGLFSGISNELDQMARDIALHHHARWDGKGYTGSSEIASPAGEDIPVWARITAIADVYDALVSRRCYKEAWNSAKALEILQNDAGSHFDRELVERFAEIQDLIRAIYERYDEIKEER